EAAANRVRGGECNRVDDDVQAVPGAFQACEGTLDAFVARNVHLERDRGAELLGHPLDTIFESILVRECELGAFAPHRGGDAISNGSLRRQSDDECALTCQKTHKERST